MVPRRAVGRVLAGAIVTAVLGLVAIVSLPFVGLLTAAVVGNWVPPWTFALLVALAPVLGGAVAGSRHARALRDRLLAGGLAAALGGTVAGAVVGLGGLVLALGFVPASAGSVNPAAGVVPFASLGAAAGFVVGAVLGAVGGASAHVARDRSETRATRGGG